MPAITLSPTPLFAGQQITITAGPNMKLAILLDGVAYDVKTDANGTATFTPGTSGSIFVSDPAGNWTTAADIVSP